MKKATVLLFVIFFALESVAQCDEVYNDTHKYLKIRTDNDFWKLRETTDRYFTNGFKLELFFLPGGTEKGLLNNLFFTLPVNEKAKSARTNNFAIIAGMEMYTPRDISSPEIQFNDRPYAGLSYLGIKNVSNDFSKGMRLTMEYQLGVIGPLAGQEYVQTEVHRTINSTNPEGWDNQIANDIAFTVKGTFEKEIINPTPSLQIIGMTELNVGTVTNYWGVGGTFRLGNFIDYFYNESGLFYLNKNERLMSCELDRKIHSSNLTRKFKAFVYAKPTLRVVIDNSLLEGGWFSHDRSPYVISSDNVNRVYTQFEVGVVFGINKYFSLNLAQLFRTAEFENADTTRWGAVTLNISL